jgi:hypothetical protein
MPSSSTAAAPPSAPITIEKPTKYAGGRDKTRVVRKQKLPTSGNLGKKARSTSGVEQRVGGSESGVIKVRETRHAEGGDETNLSVCFPQFW